MIDSLISFFVVICLVVLQLIIPAGIMVLIGMAVSIFVSWLKDRKK